MRKSLVVWFVAGLLVLPLAVLGCKGKVKKEDEMAKTEPMEAVVATEDVVVTQAPVTEPAVQSAPGQDTIPPTASVPADQSAKTAGAQNIEHNKEIQAALKAANFYTGSIDGKIGPKTKKAIIEFQKAHGLKADGRVGPKTWAELEKYLKR